jgi:hypothetical protein
MTDFLARLNGVVRNGDGWVARCPAHDDQHASLSIHHRNGRWLVKCHAGCSWRQIIDALGMDATELWDGEDREADSVAPADNRATAQPMAGVGKSEASQLPKAVAPEDSLLGLNLDQYAIAKELPIDFLKSCGLSDVTYDRNSAVRIPYLGAGGEQLAVRFRIALDGDRFRWKSGAKPCLYGLNRLAEARKAGQWSW